MISVKPTNQELESSVARLFSDRRGQLVNAATNDDALATQTSGIGDFNADALEQLHNNGITKSRKISEEKIREINKKFPPLTSPDFTFSKTVHNHLKVPGTVQNEELDIAIQIESDLQNNSGTWFDEFDKVENTFVESPKYYSINYILNAVARNIAGFGLDTLGEDGLVFLKRDAKENQISEELLNAIASSSNGAETKSDLIQFFENRSNLDQTLIAPDSVAKYANEIKAQLDRQHGRALSDIEVANLIEANYKKNNANFHLAIAEILINIAQNNPNLLNTKLKTNTAQAMSRGDIEALVQQQVASLTSVQTHATPKANWIKRHPKTSIAMGTSTLLASLFAGITVWQFQGLSKQEIKASNEPKTVSPKPLIDESPERVASQEIAKPPKAKKTKTEETTNKPVAKQSLISTERTLSFPGQKDLVIKIFHEQENDAKATQLSDKIEFYLKVLAAPGYTGYEKFTNEAKVPFEKIDSYIYLDSPKLSKEFLEERTGKKITELKLWQEPIYLAKLENGTFMICFDNKFSAEDLMTHQIALQFRTALARKDSPIQQATK